MMKDSLCRILNDLDISKVKTSLIEVNIALIMINTELCEGIFVADEASSKLTMGVTFYEDFVKSYPFKFVNRSGLLRWEREFRTVRDRL